MKLTNDCLRYEAITKEQAREAQKHGSVDIGSDILYEAPIIARFSKVADNYFHEVTITQITNENLLHRCAHRAVITYPNTSVVYEVAKTIANVCYQDTTNYYTELTEAIDEYNKIKNFLKEL